MTNERWRQIEELYHSARERGIAVLDGTDPDLRREVERLLEYEPKGAFLDRPAAEFLSDGTMTQSTAAQMMLTGQTVSHYEIREMLGAGGMGVVYKALDTRLNRFVALKFLPPHMRLDEELRRRLTAEAQAASALDHPNIVVIHDINETGDLFIAMAFHEGQTLREKIAQGLPVRDALQIARQVASGLAKAHEHGIFHRDIKPSNIMVAKDGITRIIDFGLAKLKDHGASAEGTVGGTPHYMSPEQAAGKALDPRTDLWSLGAVIYEMFTGHPPFHGESQLQVMYSVVHDEPPPLREVRPDLPADVDAIVTRALQKDVAKRYQTAAEMVEDLSAALTALDTPRAPVSGLHAVYVVPAVVLVLLAAGLGFWLYQRSEKRHWAREQALPAVARLMGENRPVAAFRMLQQARPYVPADPQLVQLGETVSHVASVNSSPPGATVEVRDYLSPDDPWLSLGKTPLKNVTIPSGYLEWRVSKPGVAEYLGAPLTQDIHGYFSEFRFDLAAIAKAPKGMVPVPAGQYFSIVWSLGDLGPFDLPAFYVDRLEVTNAEYQEFVDKGGYQKREYWKEKFLRDGRELSWEQAMDLFRDSTGRRGPSTWKAGQFPAGQADYPVGGVSWYEAAAYAEFANKSLPTIAQWYVAAPSPVAKYIMAMSNFSGSPAPAGKYKGVGPWGTYDMAGNVTEWCANEAGGGARYQLGGASDTATVEYFEPGALPPLHRAANSGFRCVRNSAPLPAPVNAERRLTVRDFSKAKPVSDDEFRRYIKSMYTYDHTPLNARLEPVTQDSPDWKKEKITFDAAYGKERVTAYLFLPAHLKPPYQTVIFFPTGRAIDLPSSQALTDMKFIDYVIQSGRAVLYPVYKGTYERTAPPPGPDTAAGRETLIQESKDIGRSIDYLETRPEIDASRIAYMGVSMGAALGVNFVGVEERFKAAIFLDGGFFAEHALPGTDQADFAPRIKAPTLLVCGKFDWIFLAKEALVRLLGAPAADKKVVMLETAHDVSEQRPDLIREVIAWLDKYLGKVN